MAGDDNAGKQAAQSGLAINKDLFVLIPLLGSALAVIFDVGYFSGININLFSIFSLSEHIVFALEVLPEALMFAFVVSLLAVYIHILRSRINERLITAIVVVLVIVIVALTLWYLIFWRGQYWLGIGTAVAFGFCLALSFKTKNLVARVVNLCAAAVVLDFMLGYSMATAYLADAENAASTIIETRFGPEIDARVIRSGDRGVLFIDPKKNKVTLLKWDEIKQISTAAAH